ncbi:hypothetical protein CCM_05924 [Cordyceps militaris CM01]|uniref:Uncharacterized protein n=2 Tax=Cordyceps militaris TaxID=73501 RepID=G3JHR1_CORMM|nr:uncharacterized protein CCM_05924 [Cordyceps militaris CM01]ATY59104.1 hypothetical protein A9K55_003292 [Cordyceps militaris]EGX91767.1 hypothetical protein CCM_05924 [Cordyceps militaris CM01]
MAVSDDHGSIDAFCSRGKVGAQKEKTSLEAFRPNNKLNIISGLSVLTKWLDRPSWYQLRTPSWCAPEPVRNKRRVTAHAVPVSAQPPLAI